MFNYPATSLFDVQGNERVLWSTEEYEAALADGWSDQAPVEPTAALIQDVIQDKAAEAVTPKRKRK